MIYVRCYLIISLFFLFGCSKNVITVQYFDKDGNLTRIETREETNTGTALNAQMQADQKYYAQPETVRLEIGTDARLKAISFNQRFDRATYRIPLTGAEIAGDVAGKVFNPINILGAGLGITAYKQASTPTNHTSENVAVGGDQNTSQAEIGNSPSTNISPDIDKSTKIKQEKTTVDNDFSNIESSDDITP